MTVSLATCFSCAGAFSEDDSEEHRSRPIPEVHEKPGRRWP